MKNFVFALLAAGLLATGCKKESSSASKPTNTAGENPLTAPADYVGAIGKAQKITTKTLSTVSIDQAIKVFFEQENRYPTNLNELVTSGTLPKLPAPPNGMKFDYDPTTGKVKVVTQ